MARIVGFAGGAFINVQQGGSNPPVISTASLPTGYIGAAYSVQLAAAGTAPITWAVSEGSLPDGLSLDPDTGAITGTPTTEEEAEFTIEATNDFGSDTVQLTLQIEAMLPSVPPSRTVSLMYRSRSIRLPVGPR